MSAKVDYVIEVFMPASVRFIDRLRKAAALEPTKKEVTLHNGEVVEMWVTPLTAAERDRAKKDARSDDPTAFALALLVRKAKDADGQPLFSAGDVAVLRNEVRDSDLQALMLSVIGADEEEETLDLKSDSEGA